MTFNSELGIYKRMFDGPSKNSLHETLVDILAKALETSNAHDQYLQQVIPERLIEESDIWVITQYRIIFHEEVVDSHEIEIETRVIQMNQFFVSRYFAIRQDNCLLMEVYAQFVAINFNQRKMVRLNYQVFNDVHLIDDTIPVNFTKIKLAVNIHDSLAMPVQILSRDIDENAHVNNLVYLHWTLGILEQERINLIRPIEISVKYGKELLSDHQVAVYYEQVNKENQPYFQFMVYNETSQEEAARIQIKGGE